MAAVCAKGKHVVADHHSERQGERAFVRSVESFGIEAHVVKPPGVGLIEPIQERRIVETIARNVGIVKQRFKFVGVEPLRIVFNQRGALVKAQIIGSFAATRTFQRFS